MGRNRQLTILAALLLNANKTIPVGKLAEAVWGGSPPRTAEAQIQTCIWRLRQTLSSAHLPAELIETTKSGYTIRIGQDQLDASIFGERVNYARSAVVNGFAENGIKAYREALSLFRGPVLAEIPSPTIQAAATRWEERRLSVLEDCIDLELAAGRHREAVGELTTLVEEYPLHERFRGQLMVALHGSGRRAEALAAFRSGRHVLVNQLGIEPGRILQELHNKLLVDDMAAPLTLSGSAPMATVPAQLPADTADFVDIQKYTDSVVCSLSGGVSVPHRPQGSRLCVIIGRCGVGKSTLATHAAHQAIGRFPDGQLYADLGGSRNEPADPCRVLRAFLRSLDVPDVAIPDDIHEQASMYRSALARRRALVFLDDVADAQQVRHLLPGGSNVAVVLTSRSKLTELPGAVVINMELPDEDEAVEMFSALVSSRCVRAEADAVRRVVRSVGYLPLSIRAVAARLTARPHLSAARMAERLCDSSHLLNEIAYGDLDIRKRLANDVHDLPFEAKALWFELSLLGTNDVPCWAAAAVHDAPLETVERHLNDLVDRHLIDIVGEDPGGFARYRFHSVIRQYAREMARSELSDSARARVTARMGTDGGIAECWCPEAGRERTESDAG